jgi:hypothetical protein
VSGNLACTVRQARGRDGARRAVQHIHTTKIISSFANSCRVIIGKMTSNTVAICEGQRAMKVGLKRMGHHIHEVVTDTQPKL